MAYSKTPGVVTKGETKQKMVRVLNEYVRCGVIGLACDRAGISRQQHTKWLESFPQYKELYEVMKERFTDGLEAVAIERAKEKSDSLMIAMLKAHRKEVYGEQAKLDVSMTQNAPITLLFAEGMLNENEKRLLEAPEEE